MAEQDRSVVAPDVRPWTFGGTMYEQSELTIAGEVRLAQLATGTFKRLIEAGFDIDKVQALLENTENLPDFVIIADLLGDMLAVVPELAVDSAVVFLNVPPKKRDGTVNPDHAKLRDAVESEIKFADWWDMIQTFAVQNDWKRLVAPFVAVLRRAMETGQSMSPPPPKAPSSEDSTSSSTPDTAPPTKS